MLETILEASPAFIHVLRGPDFVFEYANEAYYRLVGRRGLIGQPAFEAMPEAAAGGYPSRIAHVMASRQPFYGNELPVTLARTPGGPLEERLIDLVYVPLVEADNSCQRVLGHGTDVTENVRGRRQAQAAERRAQERLESALIAGRMAAWEWDLQTNVVTTSGSMSDMFALPSGRLEFNFEQGLAMVHPDDRPGHRQLIEAAIDTGGSWHTEYRTIRGDGSVAWLEERAHATSDATTGHVVIVGLVWDISARRDVEEALRVASERKTEFLATLAHELRNPLAPIRTGLQILKRAPSGDKRVEHILSMMERQTNHLVRLVDDLLEVNRISRGKIDLRIENVALSSVLAAAVEATWPLFEAKHIELLQDFSEVLFLDGDQDRLVQVFSNLLANAAKFTDSHGHVWLKVQREGMDAVVTVRDSGCGIEPKVIDTVFDMFAQGPSHPRSGGLGIGLALVRLLVELHGGRVTAQSPGLGRGSTFSVRLPVIPAGPVAVEVIPVGEEAVPSTMRVQRLLVVDDNQDAADALTEILKMDGHLVETFYDGTSALQAFGRMRPDVALLDIGMPGVDGYELARRLRKTYPASPVRLIALTGFGSADDKNNAREAGFDEHLTKPVDPEVLSQILGRPGLKPGPSAAPHSKRAQCETRGKVHPCADPTASDLARLIK